MINEGYEVTFFQAGNIGTRFLELSPVEPGEVLQAGSICDHRPLRAIPVVQVVLKGGQGVLPGFRRRRFGWHIDYPHYKHRSSV
jgi:hypothetical protein